jgi:hypothetical protein
MKKLEMNQMENLEGGRRFWGWTLQEDIQWSPCLPGGTQIATITHYVLFMENGTKQISRGC